MVERLDVAGALGAKLAVRVERPDGPIRAVALFAHCFTCGKDIAAARHISRGLAAEGIACVRFDFTGLGSSEGDFASTSFSSNVGDLVRVADAMRDAIGAPELLIGHSLGGAAVLMAAHDIAEVKAVVTIGAPSDAEHVTHNFAADLSTIEEQGEAKVLLGGREFTIRQEFVEDLRTHQVTESVKNLRKALLVMHAPLDNTVSISNATDIFVNAKHPKSFISLDGADHLLSRAQDSLYAARVISAWSARYLTPAADELEESVPEGTVRAVAAGGKFRTRLSVDGHRLLADEPKSYGGDETGPSPYDYVALGLAACTSMTMRLYGERKGWAVDATVDVDHGKVHQLDCESCGDATPDKAGRIDRFERRIAFGPSHDAQQRAKLLEIADKCPVHLTLERGAAIVTKDTSGD